MKKNAYKRPYKPRTDKWQHPKQPGIFVTCIRGKERRAAKEMLDLLEDYAEQIYPNHGDEDKELSVEEELKQLQQNDGKKMFQSVPTETECRMYQDSPQSFLLAHIRHATL